jgi:hypothetical protein
MHKIFRTLNTVMIAYTELYGKFIEPLVGILL